MKARLVSKVLQDTFDLNKQLSRVITRKSRFFYLSVDANSWTLPPIVDWWKNPRRSLKGQCHEIFCFRFFSWITFPQHNNIRIILNLSQVKVHHWCQRHQWQIAAGINDTGGKFCHQFPLCCWHRWQILPPVPLVLLTPVANLPPVLLTPVSNNGNNIRLQTSESELEGKNLYICFLFYPKVTKQIIKIFQIEDFFHLSPVSLTPVANLELRISRIRNSLNGILWGWGETDSWKVPEAKNLVTLSL